MKKMAKVFIILVCFLITAQVLSLSFLVMAPRVEAADPPAGFEATDIRDQIKVPFGNYSDLGTVTFDVCSNAEEGDTNPPQCWKIPWLAKYIGNAYKYGVVIGSILAVMMIMIGGIMYMIGGLNQTLIGKGKELIVGAVTGLILLLGSYVLLNTVNPNLIHMKALEVEVLKESVMSGGKYCSQTEDQKDASGAQVFDVVPSDWKNSVTCGQELEVKLSSSGTAGGTKSADKQTCISDSCGNTGKACIIDFETGVHECKSVLMYGTIQYPDFMKMASCGEVTNAAVLDGFYLDEFQLKVLGREATWERVIPVTNLINWGEGKFQYSINRNQLLATMNETPSKVMIAGMSVPITISDDDQVLLEISINDSTWPLFMTADDNYLVAGRTNKMGMAPNKVIPTIVCKSQDKWKAFGTEKGPDEKGLIYTSITPLTWGELKSNPAGVRWDIDITNDIFSCKEGDAEAIADEANCASAVSADPGESKWGEKCEINANCITLDAEGKAYSTKAPLVCSNNKCSYGVFADKCDYSDTGVSGDTGECGSGFVCGGTPYPDQCVRKPGGYLQRCDTGKNTCGPGLTCVEPESWNKDDSNNPLSCDNDAFNGETIDIAVCYPTAYVASTPTLCYCTKNSDCPSSHSYCVKDLSNDDQIGTSDSFCSTGKQGTPCADKFDCEGVNTECYAGTCYLPGNYYAGTGPDDGKNISHFDTLEPPQALLDFYN